MDWKKRLKYGTYSVFVAIMAIAIFFIVNLIVSSQNWNIDLTKNKIFTLSDDTKTVLKDLDKEISIDIVYIKGMEDIKLNRLIDDYKKTNDNIKINHFDAARHPELFTNNKDLAINNSYPVAIVCSLGEKIKTINYPEMYTYNDFGEVEFLGEQKITNAIRYLVSDKLPTVYFMQGHKEISMDELQYFQKILELENYNVKTLNLLTSDKSGIPEDATFLVFASPQSDLTNFEIEMINKYFNDGGKAMFFIDGDYTGQQKIDNLKKMLSKWNLALDDDIIVEGDSSRYFSVPLRIVAEMGDHEIINKIKEADLGVVMGFARSMKKANADNEKMDINFFLTSSVNSWGKVKFDKIEKETGDLTGPLNIAATITNTNNTENKIVVFGSSYFIRDVDDLFGDYSDIQPIVNFTGSIDLVMNTASWLKGATDEITIRPKTTANSYLSMTDRQKNWTIASVVVGIPLIVFVTGIVIWRRRKNR